MNGAILLAGLFVYDVFWVFGTDVMVTVAKSFQVCPLCMRENEKRCVCEREGRA